MPASRFVFTHAGGRRVPYARGPISSFDYFVSLSRNPKHTPFELLALLLLALPLLLTLQKFVVLLAFGEARTLAPAAD